MAGAAAAIACSARLYRLLAPTTFTLVSAADYTHEWSLFAFLQSAARHEPTAHKIVYDLGLSDAQRKRIATTFDCEMRAFDFDSHPDYFDIRVNAGEYAWKPTIIRQVSKERSGLICWMDSGNVIVEPLDKLRRETARFGYYSPSSSGCVSEWTHPGMLRYLGVAPDWQADAENLNAACVAFDTSSARAMSLLNRWADLAAVKECIAPPGSSRANHRQDQALLTVLAYSMDRSKRAETSELGFRMHQDID